jgi:translation initiation factor IF-2
VVLLGANGDSERKKIRISMPVSVREFASAADLKPFKVISDLMELGIFAALNQRMTEESVIAVGKKNRVDVEIVPPPQP